MAHCLEDLNLPLSVISKLMKESLPPGVQTSEEMKIAMRQACSVFILYITSSANSVIQENNRKRLTAEDVFEGLKSLNFEHFIPETKETLEKYKESLAAKGAQKVNDSENNEDDGVADKSDSVEDDKMESLED